MSFNGFAHEHSQKSNAPGLGRVNECLCILFHFTEIPAMAAFDINAVQPYLFRHGPSRRGFTIHAQSWACVPRRSQCSKMAQWVVISYVPEQS